MKINLGLIAAFVLAISASGLSFAQYSGDSLYDLAKIKTGVTNKRISSSDPEGSNKDGINIKAGERRTIFDVKGQGIINHVWFTISPPPEKISRNDIILRMYWDGNSFPSVESPIGPFFGQGWNESYEFSSLPLVAGPAKGRSLVSYFVMPFSNGAKIEVENDTQTEIKAFYFYIDYLETDDLPDNMGRFCAWYNHELTQALPEGENEWDMLGYQGKNTAGSGNYLIADVKGKGHFIGVNYYVQSPTPMWYGEGDDMIFIDGNDKPALKGTGTEDYFNTSWCPKTLFGHPYFGYARVNDDIGWLGRTHLYRFHIADPIYFDKSIRFTIEHGHNNCLTLDLASVAYWYQQPPLEQLPLLPDKEERKLKQLIGPQQIHEWRHEWRKAKGNADTLWGDEK